MRTRAPMLYVAMATAANKSLALVDELLWASNHEDLEHTNLFLFLPWVIMMEILY